MKIINIHLILIIFISALNKIYFRIQYGISGILGFSYDSKEYTYRKNLQGDITDIVDDSGKVVAHYDYDAYGNQRIYGYHNNEWLLLEDTLTHEGLYANSNMPMQLPYLLGNNDTLKLNHIAYINPFRYRSYYYDTETNLYYLTTRYYDPETGRFINADDISYADPETINGLNLFAYCANNPIANIDPTGKFVLSSFLIGLLISAAIGAGIGAISYTASAVVSSLITGEWNWSWGMFSGSILGGAIGGALSFSVLPLLGLTASATMAVSAGITSVLSQSIGMGMQIAIGENYYNGMQILESSLLAGGISALTAGITSKIKIPGFTGRGSISQVSRQISTKFFNGTINRIKIRTLGKMITYEAIYSLHSTLAIIGMDIWQYYRNLKIKI